MQLSWQLLPTSKCLQGHTRDTSDCCHANRCQSASALDQTNLSRLNSQHSTSLSLRYNLTLTLTWIQSYTHSHWSQSRHRTWQWKTQENKWSELSQMKAGSTTVHNLSLDSLNHKLSSESTTKAPLSKAHEKECHVFRFWAFYRPHKSSHLGGQQAPKMTQKPKVSIKVHFFYEIWALASSYGAYKGWEIISKFDVVLHSYNHLPLTRTSAYGTFASSIFKHK